MRGLIVAALALVAGPLAAQDAPDTVHDNLPPEELYNDNYDEPLIQPTRVLSPEDLVRIAAAKGITLQWIDWNTRGEIRTLVDGDGVWRMIGSQAGPANAYVGVDGIITEVGENYFILNGTVTIENAPDAGRMCKATADWRFEITQNRKYYRLRQFEWCDYLTDYIDIYF
ncbi:MAG: hypothetical protein EDM03_13375 [Porphyrobacter sp. IPPAS B-1204]|nr:MAG: hypothetical protein EDM03_13375 [Porphyrobacter sp. IPPAS B-1204]